MTKIIVSRFLSNSFSYPDFILSRALRIFPALYFLIFSLLSLGAFFLPPSDLNSLAEQSIQAVIFNSNTYFSSQQGYFTVGADDKWLLHTWSLSVEWQFYMLYPALIWMFFKINNLFKSRNDLRIFHLLLIGTFLASLSCCIYFDKNLAFFMVLTRSWQMIAGGFVFLLTSSNAFGIKSKPVLSYFGTIIILLSLFIVSKFSLENVWPSYFAVLPVVGASFLLLAQYENNKILSNKVTQHLGKWSYSIYLWHWPLVIILAITGMSIKYPTAHKIVGILLSILFGYLSYRFVESSNFFKKSSRHYSYFKLAIAAFFLLIPSYIIGKTDGIIARVENPDFYKKLATAEQRLTQKRDCINGATTSNRTCLINPNVNGKKVLVLGDSHAAHLFPWFSKNSKANTTFYVKTGCPLIAGFERVKENRKCRKYSKHAFELANSGAYHIVLISQNWTMFTERSSDICFYEGGRCVPLKISSNPQLVIERVNASIKKMLKNNTHVVVLDATPSFPFRVPKAIARDLFWYGKLKTSWNSKWFFEANAEYDQLFKRLESYSNFDLISLRPKLCQMEDCFIYDGKSNVPIYIDNDHFNPEWLIENGDIFLPYAS